MGWGVNIWELKKGDRFRVEGSDSIFTFDHMDGMYGHAYAADGYLLMWSGPVEVVS